MMTEDSMDELAEAIRGINRRLDEILPCYTFFRVTGSATGRGAMGGVHRPKRG